MKMISTKPLLFLKPINNRLYSALWLLSTTLLLALPSHAKSPLTESELLEQVMQQVSVQDWVNGRLDEAQSDIMAASHWENPTFSYAMDLPGKRDQNAFENSYMLSQQIDLSGRRGLRQSAAQQNLQAVEAGIESRLAAFQAQTRQRFFEVLHLQHRVDVVNAWSRHLNELQAILQKRERAGDVSGYDLKRMQRECATAMTRQQTETAALQQSWEKLFALWPDGAKVLSATHTVSGELLPEAPLPLENYLNQLQQTAALRRLAKQQSALNMNAQAAQRWQIPQFKVGVGAKTFDATTYSDTGVLVNIEVPLPLWSQNNAERLRLQAQTQQADSEYQWAYQQTQGEIKGLWLSLNGLLQAAANIEHRGQALSDGLTTIAVSSYRGGEIGILELLDAYRERQAFKLERLDLAYKARLARIELDRLTAGMTP
ncbi:TolC family protein [Methylotuvimicrobium sp.]|uniref:TolC family protein n=2 Tax=Methylotuvimicrobium sp. TaxID=2822413 RepID=UPI003D65AEB3